MFTTACQVCYDIQWLSSDLCTASGQGQMTVVLLKGQRSHGALCKGWLAPALCVCCGKPRRESATSMSTGAMVRAADSCRQELLRPANALSTRRAWEVFLDPLVQRNQHQNAPYMSRIESPLAMPACIQKLNMSREATAHDIAALVSFGYALQRRRLFGGGRVCTHGIYHARERYGEETVLITIQVVCFLYNSDVTCPGGVLR